MQAGEASPPYKPMSPQIEWLSKDQAAQRLHMSARSVLAMAAAGKIQRKPERDPATNQVVTKLHAGDVERIAYARQHPEEAAKATPPAESTPRPWLRRRAMMATP